MGSGFISRRGMVVGAAALPVATAALAQPSGRGGSAAGAAKVHGVVLPGYERVRTAFEQNLASGQDIGAGFAVYRDGVAVVDLWGGSADKAGVVPVTDRTLFTLQSTTKGLTSICVAMLVDRGKLDYDAPVAKYWPEFAANGKAAFTVGELMSHQVGLTGPRTPATLEDFVAHEAMAARLAAQEPFFRPGVWGYHALTFGTLADELVRRTDGRTVGRFFAEEVASKHGIDAFMGLPSQEDHRAAEMVPDFDPTTLFYDSPNPAAATASSMGTSALVGIAGYTAERQRLNRQRGLPGAGGVATAAALAKLYGLLVQQGGSPLMSNAVLQQASRERVCGVDQTSGGIGRYAAGFRLNVGTMGASPAAFGHPGFGGTMAFADPTRRLGIAYAMNRMVNPTWQRIDPRLSTLLEALYAAEKAR